MVVLCLTQEECVLYITGQILTLHFNTETELGAVAVGS